MANGLYGIYVDGQAAPSLVANTCDDNGDSGIAYFDDASGVVQGNRCMGNVHYGLFIGEAAAPEAAENSARRVQARQRPLRHRPPLQRLPLGA